MGYQPRLGTSDLFFTSYYPDFLLAAVFFAALCFMALGRRFPRRATAIASLAIGVSLATGLVWWEAEHGYSVKNLGPIAIGFAILLLAAVMYRVLSEIGGRFAGMALTLGASLLIGWILGLQLLLDAQALQTITTVALVVGMFALVGHQQNNHRWFPQTPVAIPARRNDLAQLYRDRHLAKSLAHSLRRTRREADFLHEHPEMESDLIFQLKRMLPAEGYLTERLASLREKAHHLRNGHVARIEEIEKTLPTLSPDTKRKVSQELIARFRELKLDVRMERLDRACAENERRIHELTRRAEEHLQRHEYRKATGTLEAASKLQAHNAKLFKIIDRTEKKLAKLAQHVAQQNTEVNPS